MPNSCRLNSSSCPADVFIWGFYSQFLPKLRVWEDPAFEDIVAKKRYQCDLDDISIIIIMPYSLLFTRCGEGVNSTGFGISYHAAQIRYICKYITVKFHKTYLVYKHVASSHCTNNYYIIMQ